MYGDASCMLRQASWLLAFKLTEVIFQRVLGHGADMYIGASTRAVLQRVRAFALKLFAAESSPFQAHTPTHVMKVFFNRMDDG